MARGVSTNISKKSSFPIISAAIFLILLLGLINAAIVIIPLSTNNLLTSAIRLIFSILSSGENPKLLFIPERILSPSRIRHNNPLLCNSRSRAMAMVLLPEPDSPVNHIMILRCLSNFSLSERCNIRSKIGYILFFVSISFFKIPRIGELRILII